MFRCHFRITVLLSAILVPAMPVVFAAGKPNVLFIAIDDLRTELGCYGETAIHTPNIDRLAESGVLFERAYCQVAVCNPSRVSIMTGLRPDTTKVWDLVTRFRETTPNALTLPKHFVNHGYHAVSYGKIFHNPWPDQQSWSEPHAWPKKSSLWSPKAKQRRARFQKKMKADGRPQAKVDRMRAQATEIVDTPDDEHIDGAIAVQAIAAMKRLAEQDEPFFLAAGFVRPHLPFVVPRKYWELYDADEIPLAENSFLPKQSPAFAMNTMYELRDYLDFAGTPTPAQGSLTNQQQRRLKHGYYASVSFIDTLVGRLLSELDSLGLADNTIVVLWSDHGWKLGEHNSWCKQTNHEIDARVPLIIRHPSAKANGQKSRSLVELVDVFPTLCDLAKLPIPEPLEGQSMMPLLSASDENWKQAAFSQFQRKNNGKPLMGYSMRTDRYRYTEWQDRRSGKVVAAELYDHDSDPQENENIAGKISNRKVIDDLSAQMWATLPAPPAVDKSTAKSKESKESTQLAERKILHPPSGRVERSEGRAEHGINTRLGMVKTEPTALAAGVSNALDKQLGPEASAYGSQEMGVSSSHTRPPRPEASQPSQRNGELRNGPPRRKQAFQSNKQRQSERPNIVFCMADDWSWPHASILGDPVVKTPSFDRVAGEGVLFENAFVSTPSCTPSRLSILAGQHHWRLREGDSLGGSLREDYDVYTEMLQEAGYRIGRFGKGVWPSKHTFRKRDSFGEKYRSFNDFLKTRKPGDPFCYWHGGQDPHRPYELGIGEKSGLDLSKTKVPACLPDNETIRSDVADYLWEVQRFDREVGDIMTELEAIGELENTILVVSGDNGMPFPRCKATLYDRGTRVPLAIRWGANTTGGRKVSDFTNLCDLAPTFLEAAGIEPPEAMTGKSLLSVLKSSRSGQVDAERTFVVTGMERHVYPYPSRAIRNKDYLYVRKFGTSQWPTGEVEGASPKYDFSITPWPTEAGAFSHNIDPSPSKQFLRLNRNRDEVKRFAALSFGSHSDEELYDLAKDPSQLNNVAGDRRYAVTKQRLRRELDAELIKTDDPRLSVPGYQTQVIEGWPVRVSDQLVQEKPEKTKRTIELLTGQLKNIIDVVPLQKLALIRCVPIHLSPVYEGVRPTAEYHPSQGWLRKVGRRPELAECVELTNIDIFEKENRRMPMMMLHELAHAYHHQVLGFDDARVKAAYERALASGGYERVKNHAGRVGRAYGMNNPKEYFAESTEAFFGTNDFFPFNRKELRSHDAQMENLLREIWSDGAIQSR